MLVVLVKSTVKTHFTCSVEQAVARLTIRLWDAGCVVQGDTVGWRVLMFRRDAKGWTQAHHGLTSSGRRRTWVRWSGPEVELIGALGLEKV